MGRPQPFGARLPPSVEIKCPKCPAAPGALATRNCPICNGKGVLVLGGPSPAESVNHISVVAVAPDEVSEQEARFEAIAERLRGWTRQISALAVIAFVGLAFLLAIRAVFEVIKAMLQGVGAVKGALRSASNVAGGLLVVGIMLVGILVLFELLVLVIEGVFRLILTGKFLSREDREAFKKMTWGQTALLVVAAGIGVLGIFFFDFAFGPGCICKCK